MGPQQTQALLLVIVASLGYLLCARLAVASAAFTAQGPPCRRARQRTWMAASAPAAAAGDAAAPQSMLEDEKLLGVWRYAGGAYEIRRSDGKTLFLENNLAGALQQDGEWLVTDLPPAGSIRLKVADDGSTVQSQFMPSDAKEWGDTITAIREWESLASKAAKLEQQLDTMEFKASSADGSVEVVVNGRQRPVALRLSPDSTADLVALDRQIVEAHAEARRQSLDEMTEELRRVYDAHFRGVAEVPAAAMTTEVE